MAISFLATIKVLPKAIELVDKLFHCFNSSKDAPNFLAIVVKLSPF